MADPSTAEPHDVAHEPPVIEGSTPTSTPADSSAPSSGAEKSEKKETLLEAVLKAVQPADDADEGEGLAGTSPPSEQAPTGPEAKAGEEGKAELSEEELRVQPDDTWKVKARIRKLLDQRNEARTESTHFKAEAEVTQTLRNFLVTNDIAREDFQLTLDLAAAMRRGDFKAFLEGVGPYVQLATQAMGITLPPDLQSEVQNKRLTFDAAAQVSRDRYARALAEQRATRATQVLGTQQTQAQTQQLQRSIENTVTDWERATRAADPDYGRKEETVRQLLWSVVQEQGVPTSPEHAVAIAKEAYARANRTFQQFGPQRQATRPVPSSVNNRAAAGARPEPKSMMEAAELGLARARGG